jgi:hypothetical protein
MGFKIETLRAFVAVGKDGHEGVCAFQAGGSNVMLPMVCADEERVKQLRPLAQAIARVTGQRIVLAEFSVRTDVEEIEP